MGRHATGEKGWLEMHGGKWRVSYSVPAHLQKAVGASKIKRSLWTDSLAVANELKLAVINDIRQHLRDIEMDGRAAGSTERLRVLREAAQIAVQLRTVPKDDRYDAVKDRVEMRVHEILGDPVSYETVCPIYPQHGPRDNDEIEVEVYPLKNRRLADEFVGVALHGKNPVACMDAQYKEKRLKVSPRTKDDHDRALRMLSAWLVENGHGDDVSKVDEYVVMDFVAYLENTCNLAARTIKKYVSRLNLYFAYLKSLRVVTANLWRDAVVYMPTEKNSEVERPFTEHEVAKLLMGPAKLVMKDLMMFGALTGARLDAIVDLKVGDIINNKAIRFKAMKRESGERYVPIHSCLMEIVLRRTKGKLPEDDLFPEYPRDEKNPLIERSFRASKHFTTYRRSIGVDDVVPGKRRSRVNYHSWRRWFTTKGERLHPPAPSGMIDALVGHTRPGMTLGVYSEGPEMKAARRAIEKIKLPPLDGSPIFEPEAVTPRS